MMRLLRALLHDRHPFRLAWHKAKAVVAATREGFPASKLTVIGVTGTDGKTTTVGMVAHILKAAGIRAGALSTASFSVDGETTWNATQKTSPSPFTVQRFLSGLVRKKCTHAVLEYSSHGLVQGRTLCTWPAVAGITNISPEHLDYHKTMRQYMHDKGILFRMLRGQGTKVLNAQDQTFPLFRTIPSRRTIAFAAGPVDAPETMVRLWAEDVRATQTSTEAVIRCSDGWSETLTLPIAGAFNVQNALCAVGCAMGGGVEGPVAVRALRDFRGIPGRIERIDEGQPFAVFVDFTVTPASYESTLTTLRDSLPAGGRLLVLMGSCGDRMKEKRPVIGQIAGELADVVVVTNEDPYTEDPEAIIDQVLSGIDRTKAETHRIVDRKEAIAFLLGAAKPGDSVVLCGKGSDTTMWVKSGKIPWNEREIVREMLRKR